jgi:5-methylcytosine-specific restriction endonuclease McrA
MTWAEIEDTLCDECWCIVNLPPRPKDICPYCNQPIDGIGEWDHIIPRSQGGTNESSNLVYCCKKCNHDKSGRTPQQWLGREVDFSKARMGDKKRVDGWLECMLNRQETRKENAL